MCKFLFLLVRSVRSTCLCFKNQFFDCLTSHFSLSKCTQNPISVIVCCINHTSCYLDPHVWFLFCWWKQHFLVTSSYIQLPNIFAEHIPLCSTSHVLASPFDSVRSSFGQTALDFAEESNQQNSHAEVLDLLHNEVKVTIEIRRWEGDARGVFKRQTIEIDEI